MASRSNQSHLQSSAPTSSIPLLVNNNNLRGLSYRKKTQQKQDCRTAFWYLGKIFAKTPLVHWVLQQGNSGLGGNLQNILASGLKATVRKFKKSMGFPKAGGLLGLISLILGGTEVLQTAVVQGKCHSMQRPVAVNPVLGQQL